MYSPPRSDCRRWTRSPKGIVASDMNLLSVDNASSSFSTKCTALSRTKWLVNLAMCLKSPVAVGVTRPEEVGTDQLKTIDDLG